MRRLWAVLALGVVGCSGACGGDEAAKQPTLPTPAVATAPMDAPAVAPPDASGSASAAPVTTTATGGTPAALSEDMARPYFQSGDAAIGAAAYQREAWAEAVTAFTRARAKATGADAARIDLMLGLALAKQSAWQPAADRLGAAAKDLPLLADFISYQRARALYFAKKTTEALALASAVSKGSIVSDDAALLVADIVRGQGGAPATAAQYEGYIADHKSGGRRMSEARFRLAEANEQLGKKPEAVALYRHIALNDPLSSWAKKANERLAVVAPGNTWVAADHITRGKELFDSMRNPESEAEFVAALGDPAITPADRCFAAYHAAQSRFKARDRKGAAPMFDTSATACKAGGNTDLEIKSYYQAGRSYAFIGEHQVAIAKYKAAEGVDPKHSYADDALLRQAEEHADLNDEKSVLAALSALPTRYPQGDNVAEAMWRLGWRAWRSKKLDEAIGWWKKQIDLVPHDDNYFGEGQPQYWLGRAYLAKGNKAAALDSWEQGVMQYPAAYYALQGLNRIREADSARYEKVITALTAAPGFDPAAPAFTFKPRPEWGSPRFLAAMEYMRLGLGDEAQQELKRADLTAPTDKKRVDDPDKVEKLWAISYLLDRAGRYQFSHWPTRFGILDYRKTWPAGANRARWLVAYPKAYWELLTKHAAINKLPVAMQIAIVREESAFNPTTESYANAWGLTQMIPPTAKQFAEGTGVTPTRENMFDPENNVTVGSRFLGSLFAQYKNFTLLVPPSYNAGPGAVRRMLRARGTWDADEFIEAIVDDQARNYSKRVLGTFFTYTWLYDGSVPSMPLAIPTELLPKP